MGKHNCCTVLAIFCLISMSSGQFLLQTKQYNDASCTEMESSATFVESLDCSSQVSACSVLPSGKYYVRDCIGVTPETPDPRNQPLAEGWSSITIFTGDCSASYIYHIRAQVGACFMMTGSSFARFSSTCDPDFVVIYSEYDANDCEIITAEYSALPGECAVKGFNFSPECAAVFVPVTPPIDPPTVPPAAAPMDAPVADEPVADEPVSDEPMADEPVVDAPSGQPVGKAPVATPARNSDASIGTHCVALLVSVVLALSV